MNAITANSRAKAFVKSIIFPNPPPSRPMNAIKDNCEELMHARDSPMGSLRGLLIRQMTSLSHTIKRCSSELLYAICNEDSKFEGSSMELSCLDLSPSM